LGLNKTKKRRAGSVMKENKIKEMIVSQYGSVSRFSEKIGLPYTTVDTILRRGLLKSNVLNVLTICKELGINIESLNEDSTDNNSNKDNISTQITPRKFEYEVKELLDKTINLSEQEKALFVQTLEFVCSEEE
jgi:hypothetical protein